MANIREMNAPADLGLRPDDRAAESTANAGRRIGALYGQIAESKNDIGRRANSAIQDVGNVAVKYAEHQEVSKGAAEAAKTLAGLDAKWNETVKGADPNDPALAAKFRDEVVEPTLTKMKDGYFTEGGQKFGESQVESFRNHFFAKTTADMARLAGVAVKSNIETMTNQLSNAAISDPTSLKTSLGLVESSVGAMVDTSPNLKGVDGAALKIELTQSAQKEIVKAAAIGAINANPEAGLKKFSGPEYSKYISGAELKQLEAQAQTVERARRVDENYALQNQKLFKQEASDTQEGKYLEKLHSDDPKERASVSAREISRDYTLTREARERMISMVDRSTKPETDAKISRATTVELFNRMRNAENADPAKMKNWIDDAYSAGNLTWGDRTNLIKEVEDRKTPEGQALAQDRGQFFKQYAGAIANGAIGPDGKREIYDPQMGSPKLYAAERDARRVEQDLKQKGLDPHLAYDPTSEYFLGKKVGKWRGSMQSDLETKATEPAAARPPVTNPDARPEPPYDLRGVAALSYSKSRNMWRDDASGKLYDDKGKEVGK
jgi:hypothetical protein